jgi:hypothetical protein
MFASIEEAWGDRSIRQWNNGKYFKKARMLVKDWRAITPGCSLLYKAIVRHLGLDSVLAGVKRVAVQMRMEVPTGSCRALFR